ncbi:MAG: tRNA (adenosine(37)-N6)-dimethylallyltransferase MiaA [Bacteroidota bacterium]
MKNLIVIVGPTAVGKTALAIKLAKHFHTEIVSADSRQFFREMNIGTAKPTADELGEAKHHLINSLSVFDDYSAGRFETDALECIRKIFANVDYAILCGGSGLYVQLVCNGSDKLPARNPELRSQLTILFNEQGIQALQEKLLNLDPEFYSRMDLNNPHRLIRAIEVCMESGKKYSELRTNARSKRPFKIIKVGLEEEREMIYQKIDERVDVMINNGLPDEVQSLLPARGLNALRTVGYSELFEFIDGKVSLPEAVSLIRQHSRNYAKRQWTWFKKDKEIAWFRPKDYEAIVEYISKGTVQ